MNLKINNTKVRLTNASGDKMSVEGETQLFLSVPGGAIKRVKAVVSKSVGKEFLIGCKNQVSLGFLHENWPNIPGYQGAVRAVRTNVDDSAWPMEWLQEIRDVLEEYNDVFADKLTPDRRLEGEPMQIKV